MKVERVGKAIKMVRDENDAPKKERDWNKSPSEKSREEYNAEREDYYLNFPTVEEAHEALIKVQSIGDFDKACVWLDKQ